MSRRTAAAAKNIAVVVFATPPFVCTSDQITMQHHTSIYASRCVCHSAAGRDCLRISFSVKMASMTRKKTTVYIDEALLRAAKVAAARSGKREYEVFEDALRRHLGFAGTVERIWAGISPEDAPSEEDAARLAAEELAAVRAERSPRRAG
jgi:Arc/MetJ family transcription regulator